MVRQRGQANMNVSHPLVNLVEDRWWLSAWLKWLDNAPCHTASPIFTPEPHWRPLKCENVRWMVTNHQIMLSWLNSWWRALVESMPICIKAVIKGQAYLIKYWALNALSLSISNLLFINKIFSLFLCNKTFFIIILTSCHFLNLSALINNKTKMSTFLRHIPINSKIRETAVLSWFFS